MSNLSFRAFLQLFWLVSACVWMFPGEGWATEALSVKLQCVQEALDEGSLTPNEALARKFEAFTKRSAAGSVAPQQTPPDLKPVDPHGMTHLLMKAQAAYLADPNDPNLAFYRNLRTVPEVLRTSQAMENSESTEHFVFYYGDLSGADAGVLDWFMEALERSWEVEIGQLGYRDPASLWEDENFRYPVIVANTGFEVEDGEVTLDEGTYGYVAPIDESTGLSFMVINHRFLDWILPNNDPDGPLAGAAHSTASHEFAHSWQFLYYNNDVAGNPEDSWLYEMTAVWMEERVYDDTDDYLQYVTDGGWFSYPYASLTFFNGQHEYGSGVFAMYLSDNYLCDATLRKVWERLDEQPSAGALAAIERLGTSTADMDLEAMFNDFLYRNVIGDYEESHLWDRPELAGDHAFFPAEGPNASYSPDYLGANYVRFSQGDGANFYLYFEGAEGVSWSAQLVHIQSNGTSTRRAVTLQDDSWGEIVIGPFNSGDEIYLLAGVLSDLGITPLPEDQAAYDDYPQGADYFYEAHLVSDPVSPITGAEEALVRTASPSCGPGDGPGGDDDDDDDDSPPIGDDDDDDPGSGGEEDEDDGGSCAHFPLAGGNGWLALGWAVAAWGRRRWASRA